jgi:hypothetical protein
MKRIIILLFLAIFLCFKSEAKYTQTCVARYMTQEGWSKKYTVDITFMSGTELNEATNSFKYSSFSVYAIIFWGEGQATVIKVSTFLSCGTAVDHNCISNAFSDIKGKDQDGDEWKICVSDYCF